MYNLEMYNNKLIICPNEVKKEIFDLMNKHDKLYNINFISIKEFYDNCTFKMTKEMIYVVKKKYDVTINIAKNYLNSLKDIYFSNYYKNDKIDFLLRLKDYLISNNLIKNSNVLNYYNQFSIIVLGYDFIENKYKIVLDKLKNVEYIYNNNFNKKKIVVREFKNIEEEINYNLEKISKLLIEGISINDIKITGINNDYHFLLNKFSKMYNIPITIQNTKTLYDLEIGKKFLESLKSQEHLSFIENLSGKNLIYTSKIINILNEYNFVNDYNEVYDFILNDFKSTYINEDYSEDVKVVDIRDYNFKIDDHVFVMGINEGVIPVVKKDEEFLNDNIKSEIGLSTTIDINKFKKEKIIRLFYSINNGYYSYSLASTFSSLNPSSIIKEYGMEVIKSNNLTYEYSSEFNKYSLVDKLDNYVRYNVTDDILKTFVSMYGTDEYDSYNYQFKGVNIYKLREHLKNSIKLSYSSLDVFNKCKFRYYVEKILKLDIYEDAFHLKVGNLFHYVLYLVFKDNVNFEEAFKISKNKYFMDITKQEECLLIKLKDELVFIIESIKNQLEFINYDKCIFEHNVEVEINANCKIIFKGVIDKAFYKEIDGETYVAVIDYKTGTIKDSINENKYGLHLQLPIYVYLSKKLGFKNINVTGFYYQTILQNELKAEDEEEYENLKEKYMHLKGYTLDCDNPKIKFDKSDFSSQIIKGLKRGKDNSYYKSSKVLTGHQMMLIDKMVEQKIKQAGNMIYNGDFMINPFIYGNESVCKNCKFSDLCFVKKEDIKSLPKVDDLNFLEEYEEYVD